MTAADLNPAVLMILAGLVVAGAPRLVRQVFSLVAPLAGLALLLWTPVGLVQQIDLFGLVLEPLRLDGLSYPFAVVFLIAAGTVAALANRAESQGAPRVQPAE